MNSASRRRLPLAVLIAALALSVLGGLQPGRAATLEQVLAAVYARNPQLLAARQSLRAIDEGASQAGAGWRPTVQFTASGGLALDAQRSTSSVGPGQTLTLSSNTQATTNSQAVTVVQPLYAGGRIDAQIRSAEEQVEAGRAQLSTTEQQVLLSAITAYMDVLRDGEVAALDRNNEQVLRQQLETTRNRLAAGDAMPSDVAQSEAALQGAGADRVAAEGALAASRAVYQRIVGEAPANLVPPQSLPPLPKTEDEALTAALRENPDILGAVHTAESSRHDIDVASASLRPSLSLQVDLSRTQTEASLGSMTNSAQVLARLSMPLYQSGSEYSLVRQRKDTANQRRLQVEQARSQVRQQVTQAWQALQTARAQVSYRTEQVRASGAALAAIARQAELGAATTLEVLTAQQVRLQAQVALATAHHDEHVAAYGLRAVMGQLTAEALHLPVEAYDPRAHYRRVRHQLFGTTARGEN